MARRTLPRASRRSGASSASSARGVTVTSTMPSSVVGTAASTQPAHHVDATKTPSDMRSASPTTTMASSAVMPSSASASMSPEATRRLRAARPAGSSRVRMSKPTSASVLLTRSTSSSATSEPLTSRVRRGLPTTLLSDCPSASVASTPARMSHAPERVTIDWRRTMGFGAGAGTGAGSGALASGASTASSLIAVPSPRAARPRHRQPARSSFR